MAPCGPREAFLAYGVGNFQLQMPALRQIELIETKYLRFEQLVKEPLHCRSHFSFAEFASHHVKPDGVHFDEIIGGDTSLFALIQRCVNTLIESPIRDQLLQKLVR